MPSKTEIVNMAISHLGQGDLVSNIDTDTSSEALTARLFYDIARKTALRDHPWPFATKYAALGLIEEDPNDDWEFSYQYPSDCLRFLYITGSPVATDTIPHLISGDGNRRIILTNMEDAECKYIRDITNTALFQDDFVLAFSYYLASLMALRITGDRQKMLDCMSIYKRLIEDAKCNAGNEETIDLDPDYDAIANAEESANTQV